MAPQHRFLWNSFDDFNRHERRYYAGELADKARQAGFNVIMATSFISLLLPAMLLSRIAGKSGKINSAIDEIAIGPVANLLFGALCAIENWLISLGVSFPIGGSGFVIARKW